LLLLEEMLTVPDATAPGSTPTAPVEGSLPSPPAAFLSAFDQCIGCRACETACPSGVPFALLERGRQLAGSRVAGRPTAVPAFVMRRLDSVSLLAGLARLGVLGRRILAWFGGVRWRSRLGKRNPVAGSLLRLLGSMPRSPRSDQELRRLLDDLLASASISDANPRETVDPVPAGREDRQVVFFGGCANAGLLSASSRRLRTVLAASGCLVENPAGQQCCGALADHTNRPGRAASLRRINRVVIGGVSRPETMIVAEAAGCSLALKDQEAELGGRVVDAVELLADLTLPPLAELPLTVVYHDPCHSRHGQGLIAEPRALLLRIPGLRLVEPDEADVCCGSGGTWGLRYPELSEDLGLRKARNLLDTGADLVLTSNPGCLGQIQDGLAVLAPSLPVLPLTDLIWYAIDRAHSSVNA